MGYTPVLYHEAPQAGAAHGFEPLAPAHRRVEHDPMVQLVRFIACPSCGCHAKPAEVQCPHCGARLRSSDGSVAQPQSGALTDL